MSEKIVQSSVATYFSKNLQMIGFSSPAKSFLTSIKEFIDNSLDAANANQILPEIHLQVKKLGTGHTKNSDKIWIMVSDNGVGIEKESVVSAMGTMLSSSKFHASRVSRGVQGLGASAVLMWGQLTNASGFKVISKTKKMKKAYSANLEIDIKNNQGIAKDEKMIDWDRPCGFQVEVIIDGKIQLNGESGILNFLNSTCLMNPDLTLTYELPDQEPVTIKRVSQTPKHIPAAVLPHPHTLKLGEFISSAHLTHGKTGDWLKNSFSRVNDNTLREFVKQGLDKKVLNKKTDDLEDKDFKSIYDVVQKTKLLPPLTNSLTSVGEAALAESVKRLGNVDFFSVITRSPTVCDYKPVQVEVALARISDMKNSEDTPVQVLRFSNFVPLSFESGSCVTTEAVRSINWKAYGLNQSKSNLPTGSYVFAISVISPFIKFKNASKESIDAGEELMQEIRLALIQAGQKLAKFIKKEAKEADLEEKKRYIEKLTPILLDAVFRISGEKSSRRKKAELGLRKILGREATEVEQELEKIDQKIEKAAEKDNK